MADFIDGITAKINKGVAVASTSGKNLAEKTKINSAIKGVEAEKKQLAEYIGNKVYAYFCEHAEGDIPRSEIASLCEEITNRNGQITLHQQRIAELDAELEKVKNTNITVGRFCQCGYENKPEAKFCAKCGNPLG